jgi:hypothetical protein
LENGVDENMGGGLGGVCRLCLVAERDVDVQVEPVMV